jgi:hypothetical protein
MIEQAIKDAVRNATIGTKYMAHVLYTTRYCSAVVDTYMGSPLTDWEFALTTAAERAEQWCEGQHVEDIRVSDVTSYSCNECCIELLLPPTLLDNLDAKYYVNIVAIN